jgi:hypothetical protein
MRGVVLFAAMLTLQALGAAAAQATPDATNAVACQSFTVSGTSCSVDRRVLAHCRADGSRCREAGTVWRCHRSGGGSERCVSGRRVITRPGASVTPPPPAPAPAFTPVYLDTLPRTGGDEVTPGLVTIAGQVYAHGIQMEVGWVTSTVEATYSIPSGAQTFTAVIGNDSNQTNPLWSEIPLLYEVFVDERRAAIANALGSTSEPLASVSVAGGHTLKLVITNVGDALGGTRADWGNPLFS